MIRSTGCVKRRSVSLHPGTAAVQRLLYGRTILRAQHEPITFANGSHETGLVAFHGRASVRVSGGEPTGLAPYGDLYSPHNSDSRVLSSGEGCGLIEFSAEVDQLCPASLLPSAEAKHTLRELNNVAPARVAFIYRSTQQGQKGRSAS